ncbi:glycine-rich protein 5-like [Lactuca sativa]|uniref:glycine-rich protein 5-like n=1 Tax=Lactuca sativa TaxID=4236 RepID=UPI000CD7F268|nr:glycine-rich protein 5-like [Lactuca sativa]
MVLKSMIVVSFVFFIYTIESVAGRKLLGGEKTTLGYGEGVRKIRGSVGCEVGEGSCGEIRGKNLLDGGIAGNRGLDDVNRGQGDFNFDIIFGPRTINETKTSDPAPVGNSDNNGAMSIGGSANGSGIASVAGVGVGAGVGANGPGTSAGLGAGAGAGSGGGGDRAGARAGAGAGAGVGAGTGAGGVIPPYTAPSPGAGVGVGTGVGGVIPPYTAPSPGAAPPPASGCRTTAEYTSIFGFFNRGGW